jgi:hypothetical protein
MTKIFNPFTATLDDVNRAGLVKSDFIEIITDGKDNPDVDTSDTYGEHVVWEIPNIDNFFILTSVKFIPDNTLTASNSNYATITLYSSPYIGGVHIALASVTTKITGSGNWVPFVPVPLSIISGRNVINKTDVVTWEIEKSGSGI